MAMLWRAFMKRVGLVFLALYCQFAIFAVPAQASTAIDPVLEQQVLQILREHPEVILESVQTYQQERYEAQQKAQQAILQGFVANPDRLIGHSPLKGDRKTGIVLAEFSDFQCPYCAQAQQTLMAFMAQHADEVAFVYKHFPLTSIHPEAMPAAKAAWAAGQQGQFWPYHDALFAQQDQLGEAQYQQISQELGLELAQFNRDRASEAATNAINQDLELAQQLGLQGTPAFILNGELLSGAVSQEELEAKLAQARG